MLIQMAWYGHGLVESLMVDSERPDYRMLLVHHVLAICMIGMPLPAWYSYFILILQSLLLWYPTPNTYC